MNGYCPTSGYINTAFIIEHADNFRMQLSNVKCKRKSWAENAHKVSETLQGQIGKKCKERVSLLCGKCFQKIEADKNICFEKQIFRM